MKFVVLAAAATLLPFAALAEGGASPLPPAPVVVPADSYDWSGGYIGLGIARHSGDITPGGFTIAQPLEDVTAPVIFGGYAFQSGSFVYGAEISYSVFEQLYDDAITFDDRFDNMLDVSLRAGVGFDNLLVYGLAGFSTSEVTNFGPGGERSADATGLHYGVGVAYGVTDSVAIRLQYVMRNLTFDGGPGNPDVDAEHSTLTLGAAFRF